MNTKHFDSLGNNSGKTRFVEQMYNPSSDCVAPDAREDFFRAWMELLVSPWSVFQDSSWSLFIELEWNFGKSVECLSEQGRITPISGRTLEYGASRKLEFVYLHTGGCLLEMTKIYRTYFPKIR